MPRDRISLNREQAPIAQLALERLIAATLPKQPHTEPPAPVTLEQLQLAVQTQARIAEQLEAP